MGGAGPVDQAGRAASGDALAQDQPSRWGEAGVSVGHEDLRVVSRQAAPPTPGNPFLGQQPSCSVQLGLGWPRRGSISAAVVCDRGARVNGCAQAPPDYRSTVMLCWWSGPGGWRYGSMPGHFPVLAQTITKSRRSSTIAFERGFQFNWYYPPFRSRTKIPSEPLITQAILISVRRLLLCDYIASLLASISSSLTMGSAFG